MLTRARFGSWSLTQPMGAVTLNVFLVRAGMSASPERRQEKTSDGHRATCARKTPRGDAM